MNRAASIPPQAEIDEERVADLADRLGELLERGDAAAADDLLERHPAEAPELRQLMPAIRLVAGLGRSAPQTVNDDSRNALVESRGDLPRVIGEFRIIREIGRGGVGVVYEAEQVSLGRHVALKVLAMAGLFDEKALQRFRNEARAAASLEHPHIVNVYSVGSDRGVHFLAMRLIAGGTLADAIRRTRAEVGLLPRPTAATRREPGVPADGTEATGSFSLAAGSSAFAAATTRHPARHGIVVRASSETVPVAALSTEARSRKCGRYRTAARLIAQAADALEYAHAMGVVHRDMKPSNLLLDTSGNAWVADFGLAHLEADAGLTATGDVLGTLRYMSPEQARGRPGLADHRSDVYSLGLTLYELLTLGPAFPQADRAALLKAVLDQEPPLPRSADASIPRDLETVVLKAVAKDPKDRYQSARAFAEDLRRFLAGEPVEARRPSLVDRAGKWAWRHRSSVALLLLASLAGAVVISAAAAVVWRQRELARQSAAEAEAVTAFLLNDLLESAGPESPLGRDARVRDVLANAEAKLRTSFGDHPLLEARVRQTIGRVYLALGENGPAERNLRRARQIRANTLGGLAPATLQSDGHLVLLSARLGRTQEAIQLGKRTLDLQRRQLGATAPDALKTMSNLAAAFVRLGLERGPAYGPGRYAEALELYAEVVPLHVAAYGGEHARTLEAMRQHGVMLCFNGRHEESLEVCRRVLETSTRVLGSEHPDTLDAKIAAAFPLGSLGRLEDEYRAHREVLSAQIRIYGEKHPYVSTTASNACQTAARLAERLIREIDAARRDPRAALSLAEEAVTVAQENGASASRVGGRNLAYALGVLGWARFDAGDSRGAIESLERSIERGLALDPSAGDGTPNHWVVLALAHHRLGHVAESRRWFARTKQAGGSDMARFQNEADALCGAPAEAPRPTVARPTS